MPFRPALFIWCGWVSFQSSVALEGGRSFHRQRCLVPPGREGVLRLEGKDRASGLLAGFPCLWGVESTSQVSDTWLPSEVSGLQKQASRPGHL